MVRKKRSNEGRMEGRKERRKRVTPIASENAKIIMTVIIIVSLNETGHIAEERSTF